MSHASSKQFAVYSLMNFVDIFNDYITQMEPGAVIPSSSLNTAESDLQLRRYLCSRSGGNFIASENYTFPEPYIFLCFTAGFHLVLQALEGVYVHL